MRAVAPTMIGSAIVRESRLAWSREKRRQRAAARVMPLRETPGASAAAWATPSASPSSGARLAATAQLRPGVRRQHRRRTGEQAVGGRPRPAEAALDRPLELVADHGRRQEGEGQDDGAARSKARSSSAISLPLADQQRRRRAGVQRDLEALAHLGVDRVPVPAGQPGDEDDVGRAGDRQQLRRTLHDAERDRALCRNPAVSRCAQAPLEPPAGSAAASLPPDRRRDAA